MSYRSKLFEALPLAGMPDSLRDWNEFNSLIQLLRMGGIIQSVKDIWWDVRPHPDFGTIEIRICDLPYSLRDILAFNPVQNDNHKAYPFTDSAMSHLIDSLIKDISEKTPISNHGTTQISVIDEEGNAASMTTSNGSGSGCFIPNTGIMLNNMMGEDDLHPEGFFSSPPNIRVSSMMAPTIILKDGKVETVLGSGGSKRIRDAIFQVLINIIDFNYPLEKAVETSRIHFEDDILHTEPEIPVEIIDKLKKHYKVNRWNKKDMYFGGVHCVNNKLDGWGDSRRGGSVIRY